MKKLELDTGVERYRIGGGVLEFNPADPNLYARFLQAVEAIAELEKELDTADPLAYLQQADCRARAILAEVFGPQIQAVFGGVSLLAVAGNGRRVLENFLAAIEPVLTRGARRCARAEADAL